MDVEFVTGRREDEVAMNNAELLDHIESLRAEATPGPWERQGVIVGMEGQLTAGWILDAARVPDATYLAALDPETMKRLLEMARRWVESRACEARPWGCLVHGSGGENCLPGEVCRYA